MTTPPATFDPTLETPDSVSVGESATATVTVENSADVDGRFVGALNRVGPLVAYAPETDVVLDVAAGETVEWAFTHDLDDEDVAEMDDPFVRFHLVWRDGSLTREIDVETG